jgi:hypothetical protein
VGTTTGTSSGDIIRIWPISSGALPVHYRSITSVRLFVTP